MISRELLYIIILLQLKPPPSSYKPTPSRGGVSGTSGGDGRPRSNQGMNFSNKLQDKANQL